MGHPDASFPTIKSLAGARETSAGAVVATDPVSANADYDNGIAAVPYQTCTGQHDDRA